MTMYEENTLVAYGCGKNFYSYLERLDKIIKIKYFSDKNEMITQKKLYIDERICISPTQIKKLKNPLVIILVDELSIVAQIQKYFDEQKIPHILARDVLEINNERDYDASIQWLEKIQRNRVHRFIDLNITGTTTCNFYCEYCYVWRRQGFQGNNKLSNHSVDELCKGLSVKRTGGICFINMCARGETLLAEGIVELVQGLLIEGHYVAIVTNATITKKINEILLLPSDLLERLFFKISFHYKELKRLSLFDLFWNNVNQIKKSSCSFTLEMTPGDGTEYLIDEIKEMCSIKMKEPLPHISFTRDSKKTGYDLLSEHSIEEYRKIWGQFDSKMFDLKSEWYGVSMNKYDCYAGAWSYLVDAVTGDVKACYRQKIIGNIFDKEMKTFPVEAVGGKCAIAYCFNNHAYLAWGNIPQIKCATYLEMRDRVALNGEHWVKEPFYSFMFQKLQENNFEYIKRWSDNEKLYVKKRRKAFILFNSPDYPNLGDHAIALAEKKFFMKFFPTYDFIEISCMQYVQENLRIKTAIKEEDILLVTGGGYTGNLYLRLQDITSHIIQTYKNNKIIVCPQSMSFKGNKFLESEKKRMQLIYETHENLMLVARDYKTNQCYHALFSEAIKKIQIPDMAFYLEKVETSFRNGAYICMRSDKESQGIILASEIEHILKKLHFSVSEYTTISSEEVVLDNREEKVFDAINEIAKAEVVVTDRLHCLIFCVITETPCVAIDNATGKVFDMFRLLQSYHTIVPCKSIDMLEVLIQKVLHAPKEEKIYLERIRKEIEGFSKEVTAFIE